MYKILSAAPIKWLSTLIPSDFDKEEYCSTRSIENLISYLNISLSQNHTIKDITDITVIDTFTSSMSYFLTTDSTISTAEKHESLLKANIRCFVGICLRGYCKLTVSYYEKQIIDIIKPGMGFIIDVNNQHKISNIENLELLTLCCIFDTTVFYYENLLITPVNKISKQTKNKNSVVLYHLKTTDYTMRLIITDYAIFDLDTGCPFNFISLKSFLDANLPVPKIPVCKKKITMDDLTLIKTAWTETILSYFKPQLVMSPNGQFFQIRFIYCAIL